MINLRSFLALKPISILLHNIDSLDDYLSDGLGADKDNDCCFFVQDHFRTGMN